MRQMAMAAALLAFAGVQQIASAQEEAPQVQVKQYDLADAWDEFDTIMRDVELFASVAHNLFSGDCMEREGRAALECWRGRYAALKDLACYGDMYTKYADQEVPWYAGILGVHFDTAVHYANDTQHPLRRTYVLLVREFLFEWGCLGNDATVDQRQVRNTIKMTVSADRS